MSLGDAIRKRPALWLAIAALLAAGTATFQLVRMRPPRIQSASRQYYFNLQTGELFAAPASDLPITGEGAAMGVLARVYSCGACDPGQWKIAYLTSLTPQAQAVVAKGKPGPENVDAWHAYSLAVDAGLVVAEPPVAPASGAPGAQPQWFPITSSRASDLMGRYQTQCGGKPHECFP